MLFCSELYPGNMHWLYMICQVLCPKRFTPFLQLQKSSYNTRWSQNACNLLVVPKFQPLIHKSSKQFGYSFPFDAPTLWNARLKTTLQQGIPSIVSINILDCFCGMPLCYVPGCEFKLITLFDVPSSLLLCRD